MPKVISVNLIFEDIAYGEGTEDSPSRTVSRLYDVNGELLIAYDPCARVKDSIAVGAFNKLIESTIK